MLATFIRGLRYLLGWQPPLNVPTTDTVAVYCHTSYWEGLIVQLYSTDITVICLLRPDFFTWYTKDILNWLGFVPAPRLEDRASGGVQTIARSLQNFPRNGRPKLFLISPKGTIQNSPWRTGYQHIAKELGWPIQAMRVNYCERTIEFVAPKVTTAEVLKEELGKSCPFVPDRAEMKIICPCDSFELLSPVDLLTVSNVSMIVPIVKATSLGHYGIAALASACACASVAYHGSRERSWRSLDVGLAKILILFSFASYGIPSLSALFWLCACGILYRAGCPRDCRTFRGPYVVYHSLFHVCISVAAYYCVH